MQNTQTFEKPPVGFCQDADYWKYMVSNISEFRNRFVKAVINPDVSLDGLAEVLGFSTYLFNRCIQETQAGNIYPLPVMVEEISSLTGTSIHYLLCISDDNDPKKAIPRGDWLLKRPNWNLKGLRYKSTKTRGEDRLTKTILETMRYAKQEYNISYTMVAKKSGIPHLLWSLNCYRRGRHISPKRAERVIGAIEYLMEDRDFTLTELIESTKNIIQKI